MKNIIIIFIFIVQSQLNAQVLIGKETALSNSSSMESGSGNRGIVLPTVNTDNVTTVVPGTLVFDAKDLKVKLRDNSSWFDLSFDTQGVANPEVYPNSYVENNQPNGVIIGNDTSTTPGVLVLEETNKALLLPQLIDPHLNIANPARGLMVFDPSVNMLAIYNGNVWTFWVTDEE